MTERLTAVCSTSELLRNVIRLDLQRVRLPIATYSNATKTLAVPRGFEPLLTAWQAAVITRLYYGTKFGRGTENWTQVYRVKAGYFTTKLYLHLLVLLCYVWPSPYQSLILLPNLISQASKGYLVSNNSWLQVCAHVTTQRFTILRTQESSIITLTNGNIHYHTKIH